MANYIFLIPFYHIFVGIQFLLVSSQCQNDQLSTLIQLKNSLRFNPLLSTKLVSWNLNAPDWKGVSCSKTGQLINLDLSYESISDGIDNSSILFTLENLQNLSLAGNIFNFTSIPSRFGNLSSLMYLNLSNSGFSGQIPGEISQLSKLEILDLSSVFSYGTRSLKLEKPNLAAFIQNLTRLSELYLDSVNLIAQKSDWGQTLSSSLLNLRVLSLSNCYLSGPIHDSLENLQSLSVIRLAQNNLSTPVPDFFENFKNLTVLDLGACNLKGKFPNKVFQLPSLQILDLSSNKNLSGSLPDFPTNRLLQSLVLSNANFSGVLPESIENLKMISRLELPNNRFFGPIPQSMKNLIRLSYLDLSSNNFSGEIPSFQLCKNLTHIDLSRNGFSGSIPSDHFQGLYSLVSVDLRFNAFFGRIPSSFYSLPSMKSCQISNNLFDGPLANFSNAFESFLHTLDLSSNNLEGEIPTSIFQLGRLNILLLSSNNLSGVIKFEAFSGLKNLTTLDLSFNNFSVEVSQIESGESPFPQLTTLKLASCNLQKFPNLRSQSRLRYLDLSDNKIGGEIPIWIWNVGKLSISRPLNFRPGSATVGNGTLDYLNLSCNQLVGLETPYIIQKVSVLDLHSNLLDGVIPIPPKSAAYVDYSDNRFGSSIPDSIGNNLTVAYFFSLSNNKLTGPIPETICKATYLQVLDFSNNSLNGTIPQCLIEWRWKLGVLNLGKNNLTGSIMGTFLSSCALKTLDLNGNSLEGKIPQSLPNCTLLEVLNLGNNNIDDTYPCSLRKNTNLRVLVLRSNNLHGNISCGPDQNIWKKLQILDTAFNNLTGVVPEDCFWNWDAMISNVDEPESQKNHLNFNFLMFSQRYYQDSVTVTIKGQQLELVKILTIFTSIDISNNNFVGNIPRSIGRLKALYLLNISHNEFSGSIPSSIGELSELESLDMSANKLMGEIPSGLAWLRFLSAVNLSYNQLEGRIPTGSQFQTFTNESYKGNKGLCGYPLTASCSGSMIPNSEKTENENDWQSIFTGMGFGVGAALVVLVLVSKKGRGFWEKYTDKLVEMIYLAFGIQIASYVVFNEEKEVEEICESSEESDWESEGKEVKGRYCVFCTKLDFCRKEAIHNPTCTCFNSTFALSSSSLSLL